MAYMTLSEYCLRPQVFGLRDETKFRELVRNGQVQVNNKVITDTNFPLNVNDEVLIIFIHKDARWTNNRISPKQVNRKNPVTRIVGRPRRNDNEY